MFSFRQYSDFNNVVPSSVDESNVSITEILKLIFDTKPDPPVEWNINSFDNKTEEKSFFLSDVQVSKYFKTFNEAFLLISLYYMYEYMLF